MTREEAKEFLINTSYSLGNMSVEYLSEKDGKKMREAIEALEQEPCKDCISRDAAIRIAEQGQIQGFEWQFKELVKLSSVTPAEKTGRWIDGTDCSCCGFAFYDDVIDSKLLVGFKYCPNCGARMIEPQERSDKE